MPVVVLFLVVIVLLFLVLPVSVITVILVNALSVMGVILGPSVPGHTVLLCIFATRNFSTLEKATRILLHLGKKRTCEKLQTTLQAF